MNRKPMYMADWIGKLDDFLRLSERQILRHAGKVSHDDAISKAELEYDRFATARAALPSPAEEHFEGVVREVKQSRRSGRRPARGARSREPEPVERNRASTCTAWSPAGGSRPTGRAGSRRAKSTSCR